TIFADGWEAAYDVGVRLHGGITRGMPKKSLRLYFRDEALTHDLFGYGENVPLERIVLNAQTADISRIRNHLCIMVGDQIGMLSPRSGFVRLFLNQEDYGVYNVLERLDDNYL